MDDSQSVELRDRGGMPMTVLTRQQCAGWRAMMPAAAEVAHFVGWVERSETHHLAARMMGIAALHPSYKSGTLEERANAQI